MRRIDTVTTGLLGGCIIGAAFFGAIGALIGAVLGGVTGYLIHPRTRKSR